jgi:hypothetical protein
MITKRASTTQPPASNREHQIIEILQLIEHLLRSSPLARYDLQIIVRMYKLRSSLFAHSIRSLLSFF